MSILTITSATFAENGKKGKLVQDKDGYTDLVLGGLNTYNSRGELYCASEAVKVFAASSALQRRAKKKALYSEEGHPYKTPGMTPEEYYNRILTVLETNVSSHIRSISLDTDFGRNNPGVAQSNTIAILGSIAPAGPKAQSVRDAINNPHQNLAYSIRSFTDVERVNGVIVKHITEVVTFDRVLEGGIIFADKQSSPALESYSDLLHCEDVLVDRELLLETIESKQNIFGLESYEDELLDSMKSIASKTRTIAKKNRTIFTL